MKNFLSILFIVFYSLSANAIEVAPEPASGFNIKKVVTAENHMVVSAHGLASKAGDEIIEKGGNAVDAAIATQLVLNLVEPHASGIGGGGFMLFYNKKDKQIYVYDGRETAPEAATADMFLDKNGNAPSYQEALKGGLSVGTPGLLKMFEAAHKKHGKLPWADLFTPAIKLSREGFPMYERLYKVIESTPYIINSPEAREIFFDKNGKIKTNGSIIKNEKFADTLTLIAKQGADGFYKGKLAEDIVNAVKNNPFKAGRLTLEDLESYKVEERKPICSSYKGYNLCSMPPPSSGGITILQTLKTIENSGIDKMQANSPQAVHIIMEAARLAFADRNKYIADCAFSPVPVSSMLADSYIKQRAALIQKDNAIENITAGDITQDKSCGNINTPYEHPSTSHMSIVDNEGNAVSMTNSIEYSFGSGIMTNGFFLNNELTDFSLTPKENGVDIANRVEPLKRPRSSMSPFIIFDKDNNLYMVIGSPGGSRIISFVLQTILSVLDYNMELNDAINQPHFATTGKSIELEKGTAIENIAPDLKKKGHDVVIGELTSGLHGIIIKDKKLISGVDARREGEAAGR